MINIFQPFGFALLSLLLLGLPSELNAETQEPSKVIECSYVYWDDMLDDEFYFRIGDVYYPMKFLRNKRSKVVSVARMEEFEMFRKVDKPLEGEDLYEFVAETIVPHDARRILFLVIAPNQEDEDYRVFALDDSSLVFGRRTFRFVNLTQQMISVEFAGETQQVDVDGVVVNGSGHRGHQAVKWERRQRVRHSVVHAEFIVNLRRVANLQRNGRSPQHLATDNSF